MSIYLLGEPRGGPPFDRAFFAGGLRDLAAKLGGDGRHRLRLYLADGTKMDVCEIIRITDAHLALRASVEDSPDCELAISVIPFGLIYRIEMSPLGTNEKRIGFQWPAAPDEARPGRGTSRRRGAPGR